MILPAFCEFLSSIDPNEADYDISLYSNPKMKEPYNPFSKEEYELLLQTDMVLIKVFLSQYHQWLNKVLSEYGSTPQGE